MNPFDSNDWRSIIHYNAYMEVVRKANNIMNRFVDERNDERNDDDDTREVGNFNPSDIHFSGNTTTVLNPDPVKLLDLTSESLFEIMQGWVENLEEDELDLVHVTIDSDSLKISISSSFVNLRKDRRLTTYIRTFESRNNDLTDSLSSVNDIREEIDLLASAAEHLGKCAKTY